jgi:hypothetical protein
MNNIRKLKCLYYYNYFWLKLWKNLLFPELDNINYLQERLPVLIKPT